MFFLVSGVFYSIQRFEVPPCGYVSVVHSFLCLCSNPLCEYMGPGHQLLWVNRLPSLGAHPLHSTIGLLLEQRAESGQISIERKVKGRHSIQATKTLFNKRVTLSSRLSFSRNCGGLEKPLHCGSE